MSPRTRQDRTTPDTGPERPTGEEPGSWLAPLLTVVVGVFLSTLSTSVINIAIPAIQKDFNVVSDDVQWISTAYLLGVGAAIPASAWLGDRFGLRRAYLLSLVLFTVITGLCGAAGSLGSLIFYRVLEAFPGGVLPALGLTILFRLVPTAKLGQATSLYGMGVGAAPGLGPPLGGLLVQYTSWRVVFFITVPLGLVGVVLARSVLPPMTGRSDRRFDLPGFVCIAGGLFALLMGLDRGEAWGWTSYTVLILLAAGVNLLVLFVAIEMRAADPLLDVSVFRSRQFVISLALIGILGMNLFAILFYIPAYLQQGQMLTLPFTGAILIPPAVALVSMMPVAGSLYTRFGPRWPAVIGLTLMTIGTAMMTGININMTRPEVLVWLITWALGIGLSLVPVLTGGVSALPAQNSDSGSTFSIMVQRVAGGFGLAVLAALATTRQTQLMADQSARLGPLAADTDPRITAMAGQGPGGLATLRTLMQRVVQAHAYSDLLVAAAATGVVGAALALLLRSGPADRHTGD